MRADRGVWLVLGAAILWGTTGTAQALGPESSDPIGVGLVRLVVAGPALLAMMGVARSLPRLTLVDWRPTLIAAAGMAAYQPAFFTGVREAGVAVGTVVAIGSGPIFTGLGVWALGRRGPQRRWAMATAISVTGVVLVGGTGDSGGATLLGVATSLAAGLAFAVYVLSSRSVVKGNDPAGAMAIVFGTAAALSLPLVVVADLDWMASTSGVLMGLYLGLVATALAYVLFARGLATTEPEVAATSALGEPLTATLLGVLLIGERPGLVVWAGMALIVVGLGIVSTRGANLLPTRRPTRAA